MSDKAVLVNELTEEELTLLKLENEFNRTSSLAFIAGNKLLHQYFSLYKELVHLDHEKNDKIDDERRVSKTYKVSSPINVGSNINGSSHKTITKSINESCDYITIPMTPYNANIGYHDNHHDNNYHSTARKIDIKQENNTISLPSLKPFTIPLSRLSSQDLLNSSLNTSTNESTIDIVNVSSSDSSTSMEISLQNGESIRHIIDIMKEDDQKKEITCTHLINPQQSIKTIGEATSAEKEKEEIIQLEYNKTPSGSSSMAELVKKEEGSVIGRIKKRPACVIVSDGDEEGEERVIISENVLSDCEDKEEEMEEEREGNDKYYSSTLYRKRRKRKTMPIKKLKVIKSQPREIRLNSEKEKEEEEGQERENSFKSETHQRSSSPISSSSTKDSSVIGKIRKKPVCIILSDEEEEEKNEKKVEESDHEEKEEEKKEQEQEECKEEELRIEESEEEEKKMEVDTRTDSKNGYQRKKLYRKRRKRKTMPNKRQKHNTKSQPVKIVLDDEEGEEERTKEKEEKEDEEEGKDNEESQEELKDLVENQIHVDKESVRNGRESIIGRIGKRPVCVIASEEEDEIEKDKEGSEEKDNRQLSEDENEKVVNQDGQIKEFNEPQDTKQEERESSFVAETPEKHITVRQKMLSRLSTECYKTLCQNKIDSVATSHALSSSTPVNNDTNNTEFVEAAVISTNQTKQNKPTEIKKPQTKPNKQTHAPKPKPLTTVNQSNMSILDLTSSRLGMSFVGIKRKTLLNSKLSTASLLHETFDDKAKPHSTRASIRLNSTNFMAPKLKITKQEKEL